jgi:hypothetical protein
MTTNPARSRWRTRRFTTISDISSSALWDALAALESQREREGIGEVFGRCGRELFVGHGRP